MATSTSGVIWSKKAGDLIYWDWGGGRYYGRLKIDWRILSTDPVNNTTTLTFTGYFKAYRASDDVEISNSGRTIKAIQLAIYDTPYSSSGGNSKIGDVYKFDHLSASYNENWLSYNNYLIKDLISNPSYVLENKTITIPHGTGTTKDIYICLWGFLGYSNWDYDMSNVNIKVTLPAIERDPLVRIKKDSSTWVKGIPYVKVNNTWKKATEVYVKTSSGWVSAEKGSI